MERGRGKKRDNGDNDTTNGHDIKSLITDCTTSPVVGTLYNYSSRSGIDTNHAAPWRTIAYEVHQLIDSYDCLVTNRELEPFIRNAFIESFLTHVRCLLEFLFTAKNDRDWKASELLKEKSQWNEKGSTKFNNAFVNSKYASQEKLYDEVCGRLSHMAKRRKDYEEDQGWNLPEIQMGVLRALQSFMQDFEKEGKDDYRADDYFYKTQEIIRVALQS